ncbi:CheR family methyltransferase [Marivirga sp.]|uniref:CheR family methyltransferase n=1 Tax=Marivirga sp. TaxID=2018662 RepID=UPI002D7F0E7B|nr:CheR family methyltransferase [Marivirga sp.]HET8858362.1 CheR family methyltransferase [Marivirga sp.]
MHNKHIPVIGIGASAGGLEPLELFFNKVSNDSGFAYIIIQHLAPDYKSLMDELLARHTSLPIKIIEDGITVEANTIYLNPPKYFVEISSNHLYLKEKADRKLAYPITSFMQSLAEDKKEESAGIILSGTGSDGADGIKFIKEKGGIVLVQDPETAKFDGMPKNAIHTGAVDKICQVEKMPFELGLFFKSHEKLLQIDFKKEENSRLINLILKEVKKQTKIDFTGYKYSTIYRRTVKRMGLQGNKELEEYYHYVCDNSEESYLLAKELLVGVTRFFRDQETFHVINEEVIPQIIEQASESRNIRIWVPACSSGEEAYSIAILLKDYLKKNSLQYDVKIFATDLDVDAIRMAGNQIFPESISNEVHPYLLNAYFIPTKGGYRVAKEIRDMITFSVHNLIQDPPFSKIDFLSCRNLLIYLNQDIQKNLFSAFQYVLNPGGFLLLGSSETIGESEENFSEFNRKHKIYVNKKNSKVLPNSQVFTDSSLLKSSFTPPDSTSQIRFKNSPKTEKRHLQNIQEFLIQQYVPDAIVFNSSFELVHTTGKTNKWLKLPLGEFSLNILRMIPEQISLVFELTANKLIQENEEVSLKNVEIQDEMADVFNSDLINIHFKKLERQGDSLYIAFFLSPENQQTSIKPAKVDLDLASKERIQLLENELKLNKENLQATIEELESSNEELQSSNEELQTSNEELESINEELYSVNAEFQEKVEELSDTNNDLDNLIRSTNIPILFLNEQLNIRRFTPAITEIMSILPQDIGRHISHFKSEIQLVEIVDRINQVHKTQQAIEASVEDQNDRKFMMRISPFKRSKGETKGIVIAFIEITAYTKANNDLQSSKHELKNINLEHETQLELLKIITNNSIEIISVHDLMGNFEYVSPSAKKIIGYQPDELIEKHPFEFIQNKKYQKLWTKSIEKVKAGDSIGKIQLEAFTKKNEKIWLEVRLTPIYNNTAKIDQIIANTTDITKRIQFEYELHKLSLIAQQTRNSVIITDIGGRINYVNDSFLKLTGYNESDIMGRKPGEFLQGPETDQRTIKIMSEAIADQRGFEVETVNYSKSGYKYWTNIVCEPMFDRNNEIMGFFSIQNEISAKKDYEEQIESLNQILKSRNNKLTGLNKSLEEFAYIASHDLKEPARNIKSILELILKKSGDQLGEKLSKYMDMAVSAGDKMNQLINSLLEFSRSGVLNEDLKTITVKDAFEELKFSLNPLIKEHHAQIKLVDNIEEFHAYPILFGRLLQNLVQNAIKYRSDNKPIITIKADENDLFYVFSVADNGIGISEKDFDRIFKVFQKLHNTDSESHGIGLAVCKKIVETHFGEITIESQEGLGSTFHFSISKQL